jgi:hypothetical protein
MPDADHLPPSPPRGQWLRRSWRSSPAGAHRHLPLLSLSVSANTLRARATAVAQRTTAVKAAGPVVLLVIAAALVLPMSYAGAQTYEPWPDPSLPRLVCPTPVVSDPKPMLASSTLGVDGAMSIPLNLSWSATSICGISAFRLEQRVAGGGWSQIQGLSPEQDPTDPTRHHGGINLSLAAPGPGSQFRVRAVDSQGNSSDWAESGWVWAHDDLDPRISYFGNIGRYPFPPAPMELFAGNTTFLCTENPPRGFAKFDLYGGARYVAWVGRADPFGGDARVSIDGALAKTVSTWMTTTSHRRVLFTRRFPQGGPHTIGIQATGGNGAPCINGPHVVIDAFIVEWG